MPYNRPWRREGRNTPISLRSSDVSFDSTSPIDLIVAEGRHIALKAQTLEPRRDVHAVILGSEKRTPLVDEAPNTALPLVGRKAERYHCGS